MLAKPVDKNEFSSRFGGKSGEKSDQQPSSPTPGTPQAPTNQPVAVAAPAGIQVFKDNNYDNIEIRLTNKQF